MRKGKPTWWKDAVEFLLKDEILGPVVKTYPGEGLNSKGDIFESVIRSIVGQQISVKAVGSWKPYRTAASWYLWRMQDPVPVEY